MFNAILVPLDGSKLAEQVLPYAVKLALRCGSKVVLLEAVAAPPTLPSEIPLGGEPSAPNAILRAQEEAEAYLERIVRSLRLKGLTVEWVTREGPPADAIITYAKQHGVDTIAISTHGRSGLARVVHGSVAEQVLRHLRLPILLVRPKI